MAVDSFLNALERELSQAGLDICVPFQMQRYNEVAPEKARISSSRFSEGGDTVSVLFGNSRGMWDLFLGACGRDSALMEGPNPLDTYVKRSVLGALEASLPGRPAKVYWGNDEHEDLEGGSGYIAIQALAAGLGMCYLDSASHLCIHPLYGSWFSLRGFLIIDGLAYKPPVTGYSQLPNPLTDEQQSRVEAAMKDALMPSDESSLAGGATYTGVREQWRKWLLVRTSLHGSEPHPWQYDEQQIIYHYTSDRSVLKTCVAEAMSRQRSQ